MRDKVKGLMIGLIAGMLLTGAGVAYAAGGTLIEVFYTVKDIKINKVSRMPSNDQRPFTFNGTTYVPLRFVAENLGQPVKWDSKTRTIHIGESEQPNEVYFGNGLNYMSFRNSEDNYGGSFITYYQGREIESGENIRTSRKDNVGNTYDNFIVMYTYGWTQVEYPLNGQYKRFKATFALTEAAKDSEGTGELQIYLDEQLSKSIIVKPGLFPEDIELDITNANKITFKLINDDPGYFSDIVSVGLYNARVVQ
jgi:hypothetical protein